MLPGGSVSGFRNSFFITIGRLKIAVENMAGGSGGRLSSFSGLSSQNPALSLPGHGYDSLAAGSPSGTVTDAATQFPEVPAPAPSQLPGNQGL